MTEKKKIQKMLLEENSEAKSEAAESLENKFSKKQLLAAKQFRSRRDLINALLNEKEQYTIKEVEDKIENYLKGKVR